MFTLVQGAISVEAALDWLCLHVSAADLPRRFAAGARSTASIAPEAVKLISAAQVVMQAPKCVLTSDAQRHFQAAEAPKRVLTGMPCDDGMCQSSDSPQLTVP